MDEILSADEALRLVKNAGDKEVVHILYLSHELMRRELEKAQDTVEELLACDCLIDLRRPVLTS